MAFQVYILQSESSDRYYCGQTADLDKRVAQHNNPSYTSTKTTKRFAGPWRLVHFEAYETRSEAMVVERQIKNRGIGRYLKSLAQLVKSRSERD